MLIKHLGFLRYLETWMKFSVVPFEDVMLSILCEKTYRNRIEVGFSSKRWLWGYLNKVFLICFSNCSTSKHHIEVPVSRDILDYEYLTPG